MKAPQGKLGWHLLEEAVGQGDVREALGELCSVGSRMPPRLPVQRVLMEGGMLRCDGHVRGALAGAALAHGDLRDDRFQRCRPLSATRPSTPLSWLPTRSAKVNRVPIWYQSVSGNIHVRLSVSFHDNFSDLILAFITEDFVPDNKPQSQP
jgi:hypothetical protein